jgi:hypothetical protein
VKRARVEPGSTTDPVMGLVLAEVRELRVEVGELRALAGAGKRAAWSPSEWARLWGFSDRKVYDLIRRGLPTIRVGGQQRIRDDEPTLAWLRQHGADHMEAAE